MSHKSTTLPLFVKSDYASLANEARQKDTLDRPAIDDDDDDDVELSLGRKGSTRKFWGDAAGRIFLKAKASVDILRNNRAHEM